MEFGHTSLVRGIGVQLVRGVAALAMLCVWWPSLAAGQDVRTILEPWEPSPAERATRVTRPGPDTVADGQRRRVRFDRLADVMALARRGIATRLALPLRDTWTVEAEYERAEVAADGFSTWAGHVAGDPLSHVALTWRDDVLTGVVQTQDRLLRVSGSGGIVEIIEVDLASLPDEGPSQRRAREGIRARPEAAEALTAAEAAPDSDTDPVVDVLVLYTAEARAAAGGTSQISAEIAQAIAISNTAYARSGMSGRLRLAGAVETGYVQSTQSMASDLDWLTDASAVRELRDATGADLVHLLVANIADVCGVAWVGPDASLAFGVTARTCLPGYTFTHEVGHNFGNEHSLEDPLSGWNYRPYSFGYKQCGVVPRFSTVMAYRCASGGGATRILNLSNPEVAYDNGFPTGTPVQNNARSQEEAFPLVARFRPSALNRPPSAPRGVAPMVSGHMLTLRWDAPLRPAGDASGQLLDYVVAAGTAPGRADLYLGSVGLLTEVSAQVPDGTYFLSVYGRNAWGDGERSAEVSARVGGAPGRPASLAAVVEGGRVTLSWSRPVDGGPVSDYVVEVDRAEGPTTIFRGGVGPVTSVSGDLWPGTFAARVWARGPGGAGLPAPDTPFVVSSCAAGPTLSMISAGRVLTLSWTRPPGATVTGYTLQAGPTAGSSSVFNGSVGMGTTLSATVAPGTYFIRVFAETVCGRGAVSNEVRVTVP